MNLERIKQEILECTSYDELTELRNFMQGDSVRAILHNLYYEKSIKQREKSAKNAAKTKAREEEEHPAIDAFVKNVIKVGDVLKFKGASRQGVRQVISIHKYDILCHVVNRLRWQEGVLNIQTTGYTSSNGIDKLIGYYSREERCFKSRKDIVEQGKTFL